MKHGGHDAHAHDHGHHDQEGLKMLGFWFFLATDLLIFACLFATYIVLRTHVDGGPTGKELFEVKGFMTETFLLLTSSFTSGLATLEMRKGNVKGLIGWLIVTVLLGMGFLGFEITEFVQYAMDGATMSRSAFLSAFFTLVGTHGAHVTVGMFWIIGIMIQLSRRGITDVTQRKVMTSGLYWHFLDVVWVFLFTVVYLSGMVM
ncbi:cytochrome (ubi)quinol oxidase subunit III [Tumebacillus flagellatus]|uniref:Cytochrome o ubiquinol oxidase subunit III n=1 Tax=Tumebacillus flagellatus TaxID=1157490 RepID=A0A074LKQ6_9BACL|nr:cytochrome (ubi)quinol oxidase subunit III [Tumebacillus flagellatus]KEO82716.1 cytochrome o ubiquinol oxidase subunit III [Tumebacillus flagellatus]